MDGQWSRRAQVELGAVQLGLCSWAPHEHQVVWLCVQHLRRDQAGPQRSNTAPPTTTTTTTTATTHLFTTPCSHALNSRSSRA